MSNDKIVEPWASFLADLDSVAEEEVVLHCFGGFVVTMLYGLERPTIDLDALSIAPSGQRALLLHHAGKGSSLHRKHGIYLDFVTVAAFPEDYDQRLIRMFERRFKHLKLFALDPYDIALTKLERNTQKDRDDVRHLARTVPLDLAILQERYSKELRPYLGNPQREDLTLKVWVEAIQEGRGD